MSSSVASLLRNRSATKDYHVIDTIVDSPKVLVQRCKSSKFNKVVVVKRIKSLLSTFSSERICDTFSDVLRNRSHPNLVNLLDFFFDNRDLCLVMEYVEEAVSIRSFCDDSGNFRNNKLPILTVGELTIVAVDTLSALCYLGAGETSSSIFFHSGLSPDSVVVSDKHFHKNGNQKSIISYSTTIKILSFPSVIFSVESSRDPLHSYLNYCAPEICGGDDLLDVSQPRSSKSDMWAFGATLLNLATSFELSTGCPHLVDRYRSGLWNFEDDVIGHFSDEQASLWENLAVWIKDIIISCMHFDPLKRLSARKIRELPNICAIESLVAAAKQEISVLVHECNRLTESPSKLTKDSTITVKHHTAEKQKESDHLTKDRLEITSLDSVPEYSSESGEDIELLFSHLRSDTKESSQVAKENGKNRKLLKLQHVEPSESLTQAIAPDRLRSSSYDDEIRILAGRSLNNSLLSDRTPIRTHTDVNHNQNHPHDATIHRLEALRQRSRSNSVHSNSSASGIASVNTSPRLVGRFDFDPIDLASSQDNNHRMMPNRSISSDADNLLYDPAHLSPCTVSKMMTLHGHSHYISCLAVLRDDRIASGSYDQSIKLWNPNTGVCERTLNGHTGYVYCLTVLSDVRLASGSWDMTIKIWNLNSGLCERTLNGHTSFVCWMTYLPDANVLMSGDFKKTVKTWSFDGDLPTDVALQNAMSQCVGILSDGSSLIFDGTSPAASMLSSMSFDANDHHGGGVSCVNSGRGSGGGGDRKLTSPRLSDMLLPTGLSRSSSSDKTNIPLPHTPPTPPPSTSSSSLPPHLPQSEATTGKHGRVLQRVPSYLRMKQESMFGGNVSMSSAEAYAQTPHLYKLCYPHPSTAVALAAAAASGERTKCILDGHGRPITHAILFGDTVVTSSSDRTARIWNASSGVCVAMLVGHKNEVNWVSGTRSGYLVTCSSDKTIRLWNCARFMKGECCNNGEADHAPTITADYVLTGHSHAVSCVGVLSDGRIVSGSFDQNLIVWSGFQSILSATDDVHNRN